jgi:ribosomal protein S12 methylthiotransferase
MAVKKKKMHIVSLGCPKNQVDAEVMAAALCAAGFENVADEAQAELILVNTCAFITSAKQESIYEIFRLAEYKKKGRCGKLVVTGCLPQRYGRTLQKEIPEADLFAGTGETGRIAELVRGLDAEPSAPRLVAGPPLFLMDSGCLRLLPPSSPSAYIKISEGCSNHCSYCVIPSIRGPLRSRSPEDLLKEARLLAARGVKELIVISQDTTAYGRDLPEKPALPDLLKNIARIPGIRWIRILYAHPAGITDRLLETIADEDKICRYLDMPVQHIEDGILRSMNRRIGAAEIREKISRARQIVPGIVLRTSLMVGYPGEPAAAFGKLLDFVKETGFERLGVFTYSREEGTAAASLPGQVAAAEKDRRRNAVMEEQSVVSFRCNQALIGSVQEVLVEGPGETPGTVCGRCRGQAPEIDGATWARGDAAPGDIIPCRITSAETYDLEAEPCVA